MKTCCFPVYILGYDMGSILCTDHVYGISMNRWPVCSAADLRADVSALYGKGKAIPLQAWTGPEGSRRLRLPDFKTIGT